MKNTVLLIIAIIISQQVVYGQSKSTKFNSDHLIGQWYSKNIQGNNNLIFEKRTTKEHEYGSSIELLKNGEFHNRYSAPCGNDTKLRTHNYKGKWALNTKEWIITTNKPIDHKGKVYKIVALKSDKLVLQKIKKE
ncbi:Lipocalin-like domain-containing protein [Tenacibaculum sp. 190524A02b]|uniref:lipocalin family protein n=1 Tax=Tenacibaculum vairaonense TaxID=3137860 RepID=UPI0032B190FF